MGRNAAVRLSSTETHLLTPLAILPEQFFVVREPQRCPEVRLVAALLADAVYCIVHSRNARVFREARDWVTNRDRAEPFSFEHVCDVLLINPAYIRRGLQPWLEQDRPSPLAARHESAA